MSGWDKKREVMGRYDLAAHMYDMRYAEEQNAKFEAALKSLSINRYGLVLDVGCGTGLLFGHVAAKAEAIVGLDVSKKTLVRAKERSKNFQNVHLIWADADYMPLKEDTFNHVFAFTFIQNTPNPVKSLNESKRVAKEDATIIVTGLKKAFTQEEFEELLENVELKIVALRDEGLKCFVAVCTILFH